MAMFGGMPGYGGGMFPTTPPPFGSPIPQIPDYMSGINASLANNAAQQPQKKAGFGDFLKIWAGTLGDSLTGNPVYANSRKQREAAEAEERARQQRIADEKAWWYEQQDYERKNKRPNRETVTVNGVIVDKETLQPVWEDPRGTIIPGPDGSFYQLPPLGVNKPQAFQPPESAGTVGNAVREQAMDAIRRGADPAAVLKRLQELEGGQSGGGSTGGFL